VRATERWLTTGTSIALACCLAGAQGTIRSEPMPLDLIVDALEKTQATEFSYQAIREYRLFGANTSKGDSDVVAEVNFRLPANPGYRIQKASGSQRGLQIVQSVLDHEAGRPQAGITPELLLLERTMISPISAKRFWMATAVID